MQELKIWLEKVNLKRRDEDQRIFKLLRSIAECEIQDETKCIDFLVAFSLIEFPDKDMGESRGFSQDEKDMIQDARELDDIGIIGICNLLQIGDDHYVDKLKLFNDTDSQIIMNEHDKKNTVSNPNTVYSYIQEHTLYPNLVCLTKSGQKLEVIRLASMKKFLILLDMERNVSDLQPKCNECNSKDVDYFLKCNHMFCKDCCVVGFGGAHCHICDITFSDGDDLCSLCNRKTWKKSCLFC